MKTTLRNSFHSMSIKCVFPNKADVTMKLHYDGVSGSGRGITQDAFNRVINAFDKCRGTVGKRYANNGEFMNALNDQLKNDDGIGDVITLAERVEAFAA